MKKRILCIAIILFALLTVACASQSIERSKESLVSTNGSENINVEENKEGEDAEMNSVLERLVQENLKCFSKIFYLGALPVGENGDKASDIYPVQSNEFRTFEDLAKYVHSIYCENEANALLYGSTGEPPYARRYFDNNGILSFDATTDGGIGYNIDWENPEINTLNLTDSRCDFQVIVQDYTSPASNTAVDKVFEMAAVIEDGQWKLEKMVF